MAPEVVRPAIARFADRMQERMAEKDEEKGEFGYRELSVRVLHADLQRQLVMLNAAINSKGTKMVIKRAVDSANYLMMIVGRLTVGDTEL